MLDFSRWKIVAISLILIFGILLSIPSLLPERVVNQFPGWVPSSRINLGLDLAGGSHLLLEADTSSVAQVQIEQMEESIRGELRRARIQVGEISTAEGRISFLVRDTTRVDAAREIVYNLTAPVGLGGQRDWNVNVIDTSRIVVIPTPSGLSRAVDTAMDVAREVVDRRINALGTLEPTIIRQGSERIVVQVPGLQDPEQLKDLIGRTARLEFKLVDLSATEEQLASGRAPPGSQVLPYAESPGGQARIAVQRRAIISGDQLIDAQQAYDQQTNEPVVIIRFNQAGGRRFANVTRENVGRPFAIVLDDQVISAPNINEPILGGSAQISGSFTVESANNLAIALRSGKLPVDLKVIEERTVGPDLGADSIRMGTIAGIIGTVAVLIFMVMVYGRFGVYANIALILNIFLILGIMAMFNATLTLPGIAGLVLTIGAAVDANVLINERIREEQRRGRKIVDAISTGYREAQRAIFDANITNVIAGSLLFYFGSGPIRGFAVVLVIGIITSVFTAVTVTRMFASIWLRRKRPTELVI
jgi:preprotein translocase subunit SecD